MYVKIFRSLIRERFNCQYKITRNISNPCANAYPFFFFYHGLPVRSLQSEIHHCCRAWDDRRSKDRRLPGRRRAIVRLSKNRQSNGLIRIRLFAGTTVSRRKRYYLIQSVSGWPRSVSAAPPKEDDGSPALDRTLVFQECAGPRRAGTRSAT